VVADYYRAMGQVETLIKLPKVQSVPVSTPAGLLALVDSLNQGTLDENQQATIQALRRGILSLAVQEKL
jgi:hypothetical protein